MEDGVKAEVRTASEMQSLSNGISASFIASNVSTARSGSDFPVFRHKLYPSDHFGGKLKPKIYFPISFDSTWLPLWFSNIG